MVFALHNWDGIARDVAKFIDHRDIEDQLEMFTILTMNLKDRVVLPDDESYISHDDSVFE